MAITANYFNFHYKAFRILGVGKFHFPKENNFDNYPTIPYLVYAIFCTMFNLIGYTISEILFAVKVWQEEREASLQFLAFTMVGVHVFAVIKILILIKNNKRIQKIVKFIAIDSKKYGDDLEIVGQSQSFTKILTGCFFVMGEVTITCMSIYSLIEDFKRKNKLNRSNYEISIPRDTPFSAFVPWDTNPDIPYFIAFVYCVFGMYWIGSVLIIGDTMIASIMAHISGQFKILQNVLKNVGGQTLDILEERLNNSKPQGKRVKFQWIDKEYENDITRRKAYLMRFYNQEDFDLTMIECLKNAIRYHQSILDITEELQAAYSTAFLCQTLSSLYVIGLILVQTASDVSDLQSLRFYNSMGFLLSIVWQLFSQTYTANEITLEAGKVAIGAYSSNWYNITGDKRIGRLLLIIIARAQKPIYLTAGKFSPMSNALFVFIVKSSYQIFTIINTAMKGDHAKKNN